MQRICTRGHFYSGDRCPQCQGTAARGYDNPWRRLSERFRASNPICIDCRQKGIVTAVDHVHHCKPLETHPELRLDWNNLVALCTECHEERHRTGQLSQDHDSRD